MGGIGCPRWALLHSAVITFVARFKIAHSRKKQTSVCFLSKLYCSVSLQASLTARLRLALGASSSSLQSVQLDDSRQNRSNDTVVCPVCLLLVQKTLGAAGAPPKHGTLYGTSDCNIHILTLDLSEKRRPPTSAAGGNWAVNSASIASGDSATRPSFRFGRNCYGRCAGRW